MAHLPLPEAGKKKNAIQCLMPLSFKTKRYYTSGLPASKFKQKFCATSFYLETLGNKSSKSLHGKTRCKKYL